MLRLPKIIQKTLSVRLSLIVVSSMALVLLASLVVMMIYARKALKEEALQKATQTLESTMQHIDNILLTVEQTTGNFYFHVLPYLNNKEKVLTTSRQVVESNPYVVGCAIALKPDFYKDGQNFMAYYHRTDNSQIVRSETFGGTPYTEQEWYAETMKKVAPGWMKPLSVEDEDKYRNSPSVRNLGDAFKVVTFCLPILGLDGKPIGVIGVDVSLNLLSRIVLSAKPSVHSFCTLLDEDGSYIVRPDSNASLYQNVFKLSEFGIDSSVTEAAKAMVSGETGYRQILINGTSYYVFYKPFKRSFTPGRTTEEVNWSVGIAYPKDDIFGDYNNLRFYVLAIAVVGLLLLLLLCSIFIHRQLLPLQMLTDSAKRIANGHYDETIPDSHQKDEIGRLQDNFQQMQQSLSSHIGELEQLTVTLQERGKSLKTAYEQAQKADRMKMAFLRNMTNQMIGPAEAIERNVNSLAQGADGAALAEDIHEKGETIAKLLDNLINLSDEERRKEGDDD